MLGGQFSERVEVVYGAVSIRRKQALANAPGRIQSQHDPRVAHVQDDRAKIELVLVHGT